jgi:hypothetical protein
MATAQEAIDAVTAVENRIDAVELGQTNITTQLANIITQLAALIGVPAAPGPPAAISVEQQFPGNRWQHYGCASTHPCSR